MLPIHSHASVSAWGPNSFLTSSLSSHISFCALCCCSVRIRVSPQRRSSHSSFSLCLCVVAVPKPLGASINRVDVMAFFYLELDVCPTICHLSLVLSHFPSPLLAALSLSHCSTALIRMCILCLRLLLFYYLLADKYIYPGIRGFAFPSLPLVVFTHISFLRSCARTSNLAIFFCFWYLCHLHTPILLLSSKPSADHILSIFVLLA